MLTRPSGRLTYGLVVQHWQPRDDGWYEKSVTLYFHINGAESTYYYYTIDGSGYGPRSDWWT